MKERQEKMKCYGNCDNCRYQKGNTCTACDQCIENLDDDCTNYPCYKFLGKN